jgi:hypothetical protein
MERSEILDMLRVLQLGGMRAAYDEIVTTGIKRQHGIEKILGALLQAEVAEIAKRARSATRWRRPSCLCRRSLPTSPSPSRRSTSRSCTIWPAARSSTSSAGVVAVGGTGTGKSHIAIGIARSCVRAGRKARTFNAVDLVNRLEAEVKLGRAGRITDGLTRVDLVVLDELGYLPFAGANVYRERQALTSAGGQLLFHLISRLYERTPE